MPFINSYSKAMSILSEISNGRPMQKCLDPQFQVCIENQDKSFEIDFRDPAQIDPENRHGFQCK
jgi:hypothetical protein